MPTIKKVGEDCINCGACVEECEHDAIFDAGNSYALNGETMDALSNEHTYIVPELCDQCGNCSNVCPVDCIEDVETRRC